MALFTKNPSYIQCGAIFDIGSGSVGVAIVVSNDFENKFEIVWSHREYMLIKDGQTENDLIKEMSTTIVNASLELGSIGLKSLHELYPKLHIQQIQTAISAPWSYTITKTINYEDEKSFIITKELIDELMVSAKKQPDEAKNAEIITNTLDVQIILDAVVDIQINGYSVDKPIGTESNSIALSYVTALADGKILSTLEGVKEKILPKALLQQYPFMFLYYQVLKHLHPDTSEICLVDITNEASEIGIVRENILQHTSHVPFGLFTIAREISALCDIPKEEAYVILKNESLLNAHYTQAQKDKIQIALSHYEDELSKLFMDTGDRLSIPKTIFLHTAQNTETFFSERLEHAASNATKIDHAVHLFTSELLKNAVIDDTALALSSHYFHNQESYSGFILKNK